MHSIRSFILSSRPIRAALLAAACLFSGLEARGQYFIVPENTATGKLAVGRADAASVVLQDGKVLIAGGLQGVPYWKRERYVPPSLEMYEGYTATAEVYDPGAGSWSSAGSMSTNRWRHAAALLPDGRVLVSGGITGYEEYFNLIIIDSTVWTRANSGASLKSAELYNPVTKTWTNTGEMPGGLAFHRLVSLSNGKVLAAGGRTGFSQAEASTTAYLYDPATSTWSSTGSTTGTPISPVVLLKDGSALMLTLASSQRKAERYDPGTGVWTASAAIPTPTSFDTPEATITLDSGKVLFAKRTTSMLYDPATGTWEAIGGFAVTRDKPTATLLPSGGVLFVGGAALGLDSAEIFDPANNSFTLVSKSSNSVATPLRSHRGLSTATYLPSQNKILLAASKWQKNSYTTYYYRDCEMMSLPDLTVKFVQDTALKAKTYHSADLTNGRVIISGGFDGAAVLADGRTFAPASEIFTTVGSLAAARSGHGSAVLGNGKVLVAGGLGAGSAVLSGAEIFDPGTAMWSSAGSMAQTRLFPVLVAASGNQALVCGGYNGLFSTPLATCQVYNGSTWVTPAGPTMAAARVQHRVVRLQDGRMLACGGYNGSTYLATAELCNTGLTAWSGTGTMGGPRGAHTATMMLDGKVLVTGGVNGVAWLNTAEIYDPATSTWTSAGTMATARAEHTATLLNDGRVIIMGGSNSSGQLTSVEIYTPGSGWSTSTALGIARSLHTATLMANGRILVAHGSGAAGPLASTEVYNVAPAPLSFNIASASSVAVTDGIYEPGGRRLNLSLGFKPSTGTSITVVENTGSAFMTSIFADLPQGQKITLLYSGTSFEFIANYHGGTGNDLVLEWVEKRPVAWGANAGGQLGDGSSSNRLAPVDVTLGTVLGSKDILRQAAGGSHSVALCYDGTLAAWGDGANGKLGNGTNTSSSTPVAVTLGGVLSGKRVIAIACGENHTLALCSDGTVAAWGANAEGQLGNGSTTASNVPVSIAGVLSGKKAVSIATGAGHSLALCSDGTLAAWGDNGFGQLGNNGSGVDSSVPVSIGSQGVLSGKTVTMITAGFAHSLALCSDGTLGAWGYGFGGQLGNGQFAIAATPVAVDRTGVLAGKTINRLSAGFYASVVGCTDGTLASWGFNANGELGDNTGTTSAVPVLVYRLSGPLGGGAITAGLSTGVQHSVVQLAEGGSATWGYNASGQLGTNNNFNRTVGTAVNISAYGDGEKLLGTLTGPSASHSLGFVAGMPTTYFSWVEQNFSNPDAQADLRISGPIGNPSGDGIPNSVKYALGLDPNKPYGAPWQASEVASGGGANPPKYLGISFSVPEPYPTNAILYIEEAGSLPGSWVVLATKTGTAPWVTSNGGVITVGAASGGKTSVTVRSGTAVGEANPKGFLRMRVAITGQ